MQLNANPVGVLNATFVLGLIHNIDLDLDFIASIYDIVASKHKGYPTFFLQPRRNVSVFTDLPTSD